MAEAKAIIVIPRMDKSKTGVIMDVHQLIQCKDCIHWDRSVKQCGNSDCICYYAGTCEPNWFCGDGEGKIENDWI